MSPRVRIPPCPPSPQLSSRAGVMAFKGGGMRTLVRAHDEVPCITAIIPPRNPEEDFCTSAQPERSECNPAVWGLSKRVRQPRSTRPHGPHFPKEETRKLAQPERSGGNPALSIALPAARSLAEQRSTAHHKLSTLHPTSLHNPSNKQPESARGEFRLLL